MKFPAKQSSDFTPVPAGSHLAICNAVIDLGLQKGSALYPEPKAQVYIRFELPNERITYERDGKKIEGPMSIGRTFTASMNKKANLRAFVENFFAKKFTKDENAEAFDVSLMVGRHCMLTVTHTEGGEKTYANIAGVSPLPRGMEKSTRGMENEPLVFDLSAPDEAIFDALPQWLRDKISARIVETPAALRAPMTVNSGARTTSTSQQDAWVNPPAKEEGDPGPFQDDDLSMVQF